MKIFVVLMLASTLVINVQAKNKETVEVRGGQQTIILSKEFNKPKKFTNYTVVGCGVYQSLEDG